MESDVQAYDFNRMIRSTILAITTHAFVPLFWILLVLFIVPRFVAGFIESDLEIPALTGIVIKFSIFLCRYWFVYIFIVALILVADGAVYFSLLRSSGKSSAGLWSIVVILVEGILTVLCIIVLCLPITRME